jgi:hypothetical protein
VDRSHRSVTCATGTMRAARFADAVAARHRGDPGAWQRTGAPTSPALRVHLRRQRIVVAGSSASITIAPRIELRLAVTGGRAAGAPESANMDVAGVPRELPRTVSARSAAPILQRANDRSVRDEGEGSRSSARVRRPTATPPAASVDALPMSVESAPPARVLRRRAPLVAAAPAPVRDEPPLRAVAQPSRPMPLSPVELNRLTDHVVQTIDRRIAAFRERRGRV